MARSPSSADINAAAPLSPFQSQPTVALPSTVPPMSYAGQPIPPAPAANATPTAAGLINAFKRRWVLGTFVGLLIAVAAGVVVWMVLPAGKHEARGLLDLPDQRLDITRQDNDYESYRKNQIFILKTRDLLNRAVNDPAVSSLEMIRSTDDPVRMLEESLTVTAAAHSILSVTLKGNNLDEMKTVVDILMKKYVDDATAANRRDRMEQTKKLEELESKMISEIESERKQIQMLARNFQVTGAETTGPDQLQSRMIEIERKLSDVNDAITNLESRLSVTERQIGWYMITDKSLENLRASGIPLATVERLIPFRNREYRSRQLISEELARLFPKDELDHLRSPILNAAQIPETQHPNIPEAEVSHAILSDVRVARVQRELDELEGALARDEGNATDPKTNPVLRQLRELVTMKKKEIETKKQEIRGSVVAAIKSMAILELQKEVTNLEKSLAVARESREKFKQDYDIVQKTRSNAAEGHVEVLQRLKAVRGQQEALDKVRVNLMQNRVETHMDQRARIRETAQPLPNNNLNKKLLISSFLGLGTFFGVLLVVSFLEWRTRRVDGVDQVVNDLGMRIIGTVPSFPNRANLKAAADLGGANWRFALNEAINSTRTMLLHTARNQSMQVVMVTSATQGEGKTSVTSQLATSMATAGMRTLIVDCDLRNPSIHKLFDIGLANGVSEILTGEVDPSDAIQPTTVPNLWVIPAGQCSNRVVAALAQGHPLETLFNRLRGQFDFVIVDSCPVLPVADALLIGQHVDGVLFSIMQDISQIPKVVLASEKLSQLNIPLLGAVVNGIKQDIYSYGYNYVKQLPA